MSPRSEIVRILVCDDSEFYAEALTRFLEQDRELRVVHRCSSAEQAIERVRRQRPDLVMMDLELPGADGVEAVTRIMATTPVPILALSAYTPRGSKRAAAMLGAGAVDAYPKQELSLAEPQSVTAVAFRQHVKGLARARVAVRPRRPAHKLSTSQGRRRAGVIAIGASTGGPLALAGVLGVLPEDFAIPILVVQHMASGFLDGFVDWLDATVAVSVGLASDGARVQRGVWLAPDHAHMLVDTQRRTRFADEPLAGYHRPAANVLISSVASVYATEAVSVVLTGMGRDGAEGTAAVRGAGGLTIAQDKDSSVIYGMPRAAAEAGAELILPLPAIGGFLAGLLPSRIRA